MGVKIMNINIYHLIEGAKRAKGLTVIIDVFRAFSLECYLFDMGAKMIRPVKTIEEAFEWRKKDPDCLLVGERQGKKCEGFDLGNSPSSASTELIKGRRIIHTTSAGTQGVVNALCADEIITGSFVNARAVARYIVDGNYETVSLVCMGNGGIREAEEDELCALYIKSLIEKSEISDIKERLGRLKDSGGAHFFDPLMQEVFPEADFWMCIDANLFDFVIRVEHDGDGLISKRILV